MRLLHLVITALLAAQDPSLAAQQDVVEEEVLADPQDIADWNSISASLRASTSARERALSTRAVQLHPDSPENPVARGRQLREAAEAAPSDALVQAMWAAGGDADSGCDRHSPCPDRRLAQARVEPGNGLAWLPAIAGLGAGASEKEFDELLEHVAAAERFDDHFAESARAWQEAYSTRPLPRSLLRAPSPYQGHPRQAVQTMAIAQAAALPMIGLREVTRACQRKDHPQAPARRFELCAVAGRGMMRGGTSLVTESIGFALVRRAGLLTEEDRRVNRRMQWRRKAMIDLNGVLEKPEEFDLYFNDLTSTGSESRAMELLMQRHGVAIEPPPEWQAPYR